tara:strand:- start:420 stop:794 length:375 start_codon:yes stop_codon:yes gene_type:complete
MKVYLPLLLSLIAFPAYSQSVTPNFTTGTMTQTVTTTQTVNEVTAIERFGGETTVWNGDNVQAVDDAGASVNIIDSNTEFVVVDSALPWQLEITTRDAGVVETIDTTRTIETDSVTNTLSVFSQ